MSDFSNKIYYHIILSANIIFISKITMAAKTLPHPRPAHPATHTTRKRIHKSKLSLPHHDSDTSASLPEPESQTCLLPPHTSHTPPTGQYLIEVDLWGSRPLTLWERLLGETPLF